MSLHVEQKPLTRADKLREQLAELEDNVGRLGHGLGREALRIPALIDLATATLSDLQAQGRDLRAEASRLEAVQAELRRKAPDFLDAIGDAAALDDARRMRSPEPEQWWWFLDRAVQARRRARWRRLATAVGVAGVVLLILFVVYQQFLAPDPATRERFAHERAAEKFVSEGDLAGALNEVEQALAAYPTDAGFLIFKGVLQQGLGRPAAAEDTFAAAESSVPDRASFLRTRGEMYLFTDQAEAALADAEALTELDPESAAGYLLLARSHEQLGHHQPAIDAYQKAIALADAQGQSSLSMTARFNLGMLLQQGPPEPELPSN